MQHQHIKSQHVVNMVSPLALAASANMETGVLLLCKEALVTAIQDRRLGRLHLRVLAALVNFVNTRNAKAWPDRQTIAKLLDVEPVAVSNKLRELRVFGYLIAERERVPEANNRSLMVYTFGNIDHEGIRREIQAYVDRIGKVTRTGDSQKSPNQVTVTQPGDYEAPKVTQPGDSRALKVTQPAARKSPSQVHSNSKKESEVSEVSLVASPSAQPTRGTRLPADWQLPRAYGEWTLAEFPRLGAVQVRDEGHRFHDYWIAKSGKDATKLDWFATWRNWCRNSKWATTAQKEPELQKISRMVDDAFDRMHPTTTPKHMRLTHER